MWYLRCLLQSLVYIYRDDELELDNIRPVRNNLCDLMRVPRPVLKKVNSSEPGPENQQLLELPDQSIT